MYVYRTTSSFTSVCKYKPMKLLTFIFAQRYLSSEKQPFNLFTQLSVEFEQVFNHIFQ